MFLVETIKEEMEMNGTEGEDIVKRLEERKRSYPHRASFVSSPIPLLPTIFDSFITDTKEWFEIEEDA